MKRLVLHGVVLGFGGLLRWKEEDQWLVGHRDFDVLAQGATLAEATDAWCVTFAHEVLFLIQDGRTIADVDKTPPDVLAEWLAKHDACNGDEVPRLVRSDRSGPRRRG